MAASSDCHKQPMLRTVIRVEDAIRRENTEQAVNLLRCHPFDDHFPIIFTLSLRWPSSDTTIRNVIKSLYFNEESTSDDHMKQAAEIALLFEHTMCIMNIVRESHPLLQAIKQGDVSRVQTLLQQQPREETVRLITQGPDVKSLDMQTLWLRMCEQVISALKSNYTMSDKLMATLVDLMPDYVRKYSDLNLPTVSRYLATPTDTWIEIIQLVLDHFDSTSQLPELYRSDPIVMNFGEAIAANKPEAALIIAQTLLDKIPERLRQKVCLEWLIYFVNGGVCGEEVISLHLKSLKYDDVVENVIIGFLINAWAGEIDEKVLLAIMDIIPQDRCAKVLTCNFDPKKGILLDTWKKHFEICSGSFLSVALSSGNMKYARKLLTQDHLKGLVSHIIASPDLIQTEMLALCQPYLTDFIIPDHPNAKLQMHALVCFNDFEGITDLRRDGAAAEANILADSFNDVGIKMQPVIRNWTTYSLLQGLRKFCSKIKYSCSLAVICVMTHGKSGLLYAYDENNQQTTDNCKIGDLLEMLAEYLPQHVPKLLIIQACQGLTLPTDQVPPVSPCGGSSTLDAAMETDAKRAKSGKDDLTNVHVEIEIPNTTLLMSTLYGSDAHRNHFIPALAEEIRKADGVCTVHDMFTAASHNMMSNPEEKYQRQIPEYRTSNRQNLIIPKRVTETEAQPDRGMDNHREGPGPSTEARSLERDNRRENSDLSTKVVFPNKKKPKKTAGCLVM